MLSTKSEVDRHVNDLLSKFKTDAEIDAKSFVIAKLYFKVNDFENAVKYAHRYVINASNSAPGQKLLGESYERSGKLLKALEAYRASIEIDGKQKDVVFRVCELLCNPEIPLAKAQANYWLDRLQGLHPNHSVIFKLKERILYSDPTTEKNPIELEKLIISEVIAHPADHGARIRLLKLLMDTKRAKVAQTQAAELLSRGVFRNRLPFYECLARICEVYEKEGGETNLDFQLHKLSVLDRLCYLTLQDCGSEKRSLNECTAAAFSFDQKLQAVSAFQPKSSERTFFQSALRHYCGQLAYHLAVLKLRRTKKEPGEWQRAIATVCPILLYATEAIDIEGRYETFYRDWWIVDGAERVSVATHVLKALAECKGPSFIQEIQQACGGKWRERAYQKLFGNQEDHGTAATSCFVNNSSFLSIPTTLPSDAELAAFDKESQSGFPQSLHYGVWLGIANVLPSGLMREEFRCEVVSELPLTTSNLNNAGPQTLSQLDVDAFLYAAVFCSKSQSRNLSSGHPSVLPVSITESLCTPQQSDWWNTMYETYMNQASSSTSEARLRLRKGIEAVRALGNHMLHPKLLVLLAKQFELRANSVSDATMKEALERRAEAYWTAVIPPLERMEKRQFIRDVSVKLFDYNCGDWDPSDIRSALEDGKLFKACQLMNRGKDEDAVEAFVNLKSPYATYYQAKIYMKMAREVMNRKKEAITSEHRSQYVILMTRARDSLRISEDRLRKPSVSENHPLHSLLQKTFDQVDQGLMRFQDDGKENKTCFETESNAAVANSDHLGDLSTWTDGVATPRLVRHNRGQSTPRAGIPPRPDPVLDEMRLVRSDVADIKPLLRELVSEFKKMSAVMETMSTRMETVLTAQASTTTHQPPVDDVRSDDLFQEFQDEEEYGVEELVQFSSNMQQQYGAVGTRGMQQYLPPMFPMHRHDPSAAPLVPYYPGYVWSPGLPFSEGQQLPDFRQQAGPPADNKRVPNVVITSSDTLPTYSSGVQPAMSVTIPPQHVRTAPQPLPHQFQIPLPPTPPVVTQSPSDKYQARAYDPVPATASPKKPLLPTPATANQEKPGEQKESSLLTNLLSSTTVKPAVPLFQAPVVSPSTTATPVNLFATKSNSPLTSVNVSSPVTTTKSETSVFMNSSLVTPPRFSFSPSTPSKPVNSSVLNTPPSGAFNSSQEESDADYDPRPDFKAIVSLPEEVEVVTGEEGETRLFSSHARLYVFRESEWKERGRGTVSILHNETSGKTRLVMRRDQVLKVCANHIIRPEMKLDNMPKVANAFLWAAADFSENEVFNEKFCIKFKTLDESKDFEYAFNKGRELFKATPTKPKTPVSEAEPQPVNLSPFSFGAKPADKESIVFGTGGKEILKTEAVTMKTPAFGNIGKDTVKSPVVMKTPIVESGAKDGLMSDTPVFGAKSSVMDFTSIAKSGSLADAFKPSPTFTGFAGAGRQLFGSSNGGEQGTPESPGADDEFEPSQDFKPVVPLPDLVELRTGEEDEQVLFEERAKILRFHRDSKEWKEKGVGNFKILRHHDTGKIRLLMRREQVHKVCCNHYLDEKMTFERMKQSEKAATWVAQDFSEEEYKPEMLCIRFGRVETLNKFLLLIEDLQQKLKMVSMAPTVGATLASKSKEDEKPFSEMFKMPVGTWECEICLVRNKPDGNKCVSCETPRPGVTVNAFSQAQQKPLSEMFKKAVGSWDCEICLVRNNADNNKCASCETPRPGAPVDSPKPVTKFEMPKLTSGFSFGIPATTPVTATVPTTGPAPTATPAFTFGVPPTKTVSGASSKPIIFGANKTNSAATFTFGVSSAANTVDSSPKFVHLSKEPEAVTPTKESAQFKIGTAEKFSFTFKKPVDDTKQSPDVTGNDSVDDAEDVEREDENLTFKPVVPLPAKVPVQTGEENEEVLYCHRAKLLRWTDKEWKERGLGDVKILRHNETGKLRLLMRREQVLKTCLNHYLTKDLQFHAKDNKSWLWAAPDFAEGTLDFGQFCLKFRDETTAQGFWKALEDARKETISSPEATRTTRSKSIGSDEGVVAVYEYKVTPEQKAAADRLQLPPNYFRYENAEPCPGCRGCDSDTERTSPAKAVGLSRSPAETNIVEPTDGTVPRVKKEDNSPVPAKEPPTMQAADSTYTENSKKPHEKPLLQSGLLPKPSETIFATSELGKLKPMEPEKPAEPETPKSSVFMNFSFKNVDVPNREKTPTIFGSSAGNIFGGIKSGGSLFGASTTSGSIFGSSNVPLTTPGFGGSIFGGDALSSSKPVFTASPELTFGQLASSSVGSFGTGAPGWSTEVKPLFASSNSKDEEGEDGGEGEHDPQFQPIVELPPLVETHTGEEAEHVLFKARGKLYRWTDEGTKEWKERGIGEIKVLHDPARGTYRLLLRREQVHKVVLNMRITSSMDMAEKPNNPRSLMWSGMNYIDGTNNLEKLAIRFKLDSEVDEFKAAVDNCLIDIKDTSRDMSRFDDSSNTTAIAVDLTVGSSLSAGGHNSTVEVEEEEEETDEEDEEDYGEGDSIVLIKQGVSLYVLEETTEKYVCLGERLTLQVLETNHELRFIVDEDSGKMFSDIVVDPLTEPVFKLPPRGAMWVGLDKSLEEPILRNLLVDLPDEDDAEDLYVTVDAKELPQDFEDTVRKRRQ